MDLIDELGCANPLGILLDLVVPLHFIGNVNLRACSKALHDACGCMILDACPGHPGRPHWEGNVALVKRLLELNTNSPYASKHAHRIRALLQLPSYRTFVVLRDGDTGSICLKSDIWPWVFDPNVHPHQRVPLVQAILDALASAAPRDMFVDFATQGLHTALSSSLVDPVSWLTRLPRVIEAFLAAGADANPPALI